nr:MAG TPA: hypothetical protein [Caudoviricetes sp.]
MLLVERMEMVEVLTGGQTDTPPNTFNEVDHRLFAMPSSKIL